MGLKLSSFLAYRVYNTCMVDSVHYFILSNQCLVLITRKCKRICAGEASALKISEECHVSRVYVDNCTFLI